MNAPELKRYIGLGDPRTYPEVVSAVRHLDEDNLAEVIGDLTPQSGRRKAVVRDSRQVTVYAQVLSNEEAHAALREYEDLELASLIVQDASLPERIQNLSDRIDLLLNDVYRASDGEPLRAPSEALYARESTLRSAVRALHENAE